MIQFKPIIDSDITVIVKMMQEFYAIDNYPINPEISNSLFQEFIADKNLGKAWLIISDDVVVGYVILTFIFSFEFQGKIAFLDELSEKARGKGIGNQAVAFIIEESQKLSLKLIYLEIENHNQNAQKLYIASGFELHNRKLMAYKTR